MSELVGAERVSRTRRAAVLCAAMLLAGCAVQDDKYEKNNTITLAKPLGSLVAGGKLHYPDLVAAPEDPDWYRVTNLPPFRKVEARLEDFDEGSGLGIEVYNGRVKRGGPNPKVNWDQEDGGNGFELLVTGIGKEDSAEDYTLVIEDKGPMDDDALEQNDNRAAARAWTKFGSWEPMWAFDDDWMTVEVPDLFGVEVRLTPKRPVQRAKYEFLTRGGSRLGEGLFNKPVTFTLGRDDLRQDDRALLVGLTLQGNPPFPYEMRVELRPPQLEQLTAELEKMQRDSEPRPRITEFAGRLARLVIRSGGLLTASKEAKIALLEATGRKLLQGGQMDLGIEAYRTAGVGLGSPPSQRRLDVIQKATQEPQGFRAYLDAEANFDAAQARRDRRLLDLALEACQLAANSSQDETVRRLCQTLEEDIRLAQQEWAQ